MVINGNEKIKRKRGPLGSRGGWVTDGGGSCTQPSMPEVKNNGENGAKKWKCWDLLASPTSHTKQQTSPSTWGTLPPSPGAGGHAEVTLARSLSSRVSQTIQMVRSMCK